MSDVDTLFSVEDTSQSQTEQVAETTQTETVETDLTPNAEQQAVLDRIRTASAQAGGFELQNGRVVAKKEEGTRTEQSDPVVELNYKGQVVQKPLAEVKNLAQKGFAFEQNSYELNREREELTRKAQELDRLLQTVQNFTPPASSPEPELSDAEIAQRAIQYVKEKFGKDDPDFEFDPLSPEQQTAFNRAIAQQVNAEEAKRQQKEAAVHEENTRTLRLTNWEQAQKQSDPQYDSVIQWITEPVGQNPQGEPIPRLKTILTAEQFAVADQAYRTGDTATLSKIVTYCKAKYQTQKLGLPTKAKAVAPPVVQPPGNGATQTQGAQKPFEWPKTTLTQDERLNLIKQRFTRR